MYGISSKSDERGMEWVEPNSSYPHLVKHRDDQNVSRTPIVNHDPLHVDIGNHDRYDQQIIMGEVQASQILIGESDRLKSFRCRRGVVINLLLYSPISLSRMPFSG